MCALEAEEGFATADDGVRIFFRVTGKGPFALVMPVNWGMDSYVYGKGLSSLEFYLALVTYDPRGVGRSDSPRSPDEYAVDTTARDATRVADAAGLPRSVVLGHSDGGAVALTYALAFPKRVSHLILVSTATRSTSPSPLGSEGPMPTTEEAMRERVRVSTARAVRHPGRFDRAMDELLPRMRFSPERLRWASARAPDADALRSRLAEIRVPVLIVHGREDRLVPRAEAQALHAAIHASTLVVLEDCGHWPHVEKRTEFVSAVKRFLGLDERILRSF
ncbi:MAG TPA: alpha/beta hydrolase [Thermoplasmata archaeon]|nr:alpha/beta hydrolase [Thermoplasmata archaeon]